MMLRHFILICVTMLVASGAFAAGGNLSSQDISNIRQKARNSVKSWHNYQDSNQQAGDAPTQQGLRDSLTGNISATDGGKKSGYSNSRKASGSLSCKEGAHTTLMGLKINVTACDNNYPTVNLCDGMEYGFVCIKDGTPVATQNYQTQLKGSQTFKPSNTVNTLHATYHLDTQCQNGQCDFTMTKQNKLSAGYDADDRRSVMANITNQYQGADSQYSGLLNTFQSSKYKQAQQTVKDEKYNDCQQKRMKALYTTGKPMVTCDPNDPRTLTFKVDKRPGPNQGNLMCTDESDGQCKQPIAVNDYQIMKGSQICHSSYVKAKRTCHVKTQPITDPVKVLGSNKNNVSSCGRGCLELRVGNPTHNAYNGNCSYFTSNTKIVVNAPKTITSAKLTYVYFDDYMQVSVGPIGQEGLVWKGPHDWEFPNVSGHACELSTGWVYRPNVDVTNAFSSASPGETINFKIRFEVTGSGGGYGIIKLHYLANGTKSHDGCLYEENYRPTANNAQGCYLQHNQCLDSAPRIIGGITYHPSCWDYKKDFECYNGLHKTCNATKMHKNGWVKHSQKLNKQFPTSVTGQPTSLPVAWDNKWVYSNTTGTHAYGCATATHTTTETDATGGTITTTHQWCYKEPTKECHPSPPATHQRTTVCNVVDKHCVKNKHGLCVKQQQHYHCKSTFVCMNAYGNDQHDESIPPDNSNLLGQVMAQGELANQMSHAIQKGVTKDPDGAITLFSGKPDTCRYMEGKAKSILDVYGYIYPFLMSIANIDTGAAHCCRSNPKKIKTGTNYGFCTNDDKKLAAARMSNRAHKIGEKKGNLAFCINYATGGKPALPTHGKSHPIHEPLGCRGQVIMNVLNPGVAAARSVYDGSITKDKIQVDKKQTWCYFDSVFARVIQEQGRQQLNQLAAGSSTNASHHQQSFTFFSQGHGQWTPAKTYNGNTLRFWQWDDRCGDDSDFSVKQGKTDQLCPIKTAVYVAVCSLDSGCGGLPANPVLQSSGTWNIQKLDAATNQLQAINKYVVMQGQCAQDGHCLFNINAWPAGVGGQLTIPLDLSWQLHSARSGWKPNQWEHNSVHVQAYTHPTSDDSKKAKLRICMGTDDQCNSNGNWQLLNIDNPTNNTGQVFYAGLKNGNTKVGGSQGSAGNDPIKMNLIGQCDDQTDSCAYRLTLNIKVTAKPWSKGLTYNERKYHTIGWAVKIHGIGFDGWVSDFDYHTKWNYDYHPDCSGFTLNQFQALDLSKMDLSDFVDSITADAKDKVKDLTMSTTGNALGVDIAKQDADDIANGNPIKTVPNGQSHNRYSISHTNGYAGLTTTTFRPNFKLDDRTIRIMQNGEARRAGVSSIAIKWGDGHKDTIGPSQTATHVYGHISDGGNVTPDKNTLYHASVIWHTTEGDFIDHFNYQLWVSKADHAPQQGGKKPLEEDPTQSGGAVYSQDNKTRFNHLPQDMRDIVPDSP